MKKLLLATAIVISTMSTSAFAFHLSDMNYNYADIKLGQADFGDVGDFKTRSISFSKTIYNRTYVAGSYKYAEHEDASNFNVDSFELKAGHFYDMHLAVPADFFVEAGFHRLDLGGNLDDQGLSVEMGVKSNFGYDYLDFSASIGGRDFVENDEEDMFLQTELFFNANDNLSFGITYEYQNKYMGIDDVNSIEAGLRFKF